MFKRNRAYLSILLIFSFSLLVVPKTFLHHCDHQHFTAGIKDKHDGPSIEKSVEKCAVCDLQAPQLFTPEQKPLYFFQKGDLPQYVTTYTTTLRTSSATFYLRGPPQTV